MTIKNAKQLYLTSTQILILTDHLLKYFAQKLGENTKFKKDYNNVQGDKQLLNMVLVQELLIKSIR